MESFLHSIYSVCIILLLTATGYFLAAKGWMSPQAKAFISKYLLTLAVPAMCINQLSTNLTRDMVFSFSKSLALLFLQFIVQIAAALLAARLLKLPRRQIGVFVMMASLSNAIFIGYAMCSELFGDSCVTYVMLYYLCNTVFVQFIGSSLVRWGGTGELGSPLQAVVSFFKTPSVIVVFVSVFLVMFDIELPHLAMSYLNYLNLTVTPLALALTGYIIYDIGLRNLRIGKTLGVMLLFRFVLSPLLCVFGCSLFGVTGLARDVFTVETSMPVVTQTVVFASEYGADEQLAAQGAAISTLGCFVEIPLLMLLLR